MCICVCAARSEMRGWGSQFHAPWPCDRNPNSGFRAGANFSNLRNQFMGCAVMGTGILSSPAPVLSAGLNPARGFSPAPHLASGHPLNGVNYTVISRNCEGAATSQGMPRHPPHLLVFDDFRFGIGIGLPTTYAENLLGSLKHHQRLPASPSLLAWRAGRPPLEQPEVTHACRHLHQAETSQAPFPFFLSPPVPLHAPDT
jgi:hypothetical protein